MQLKYERKKYNENDGVPTARFDVIEPDRKLSFLHAVLRKEFRSDLIMQDVSIDFSKILYTHTLYLLIT